jgi:small subunit ribosomal protein S16
LAVRIRLTRVGATKRPAYRVIAIDKRRSRDGRALEILGFYDPLTEPATVQLDRAKIDAWIGKGAQPSDTVVKLLRQSERTSTAGTEAEKPKRATRAAKPKPSKKAQAKAASAPETPSPAATDAPAEEAAADATVEEAAADATVETAPEEPAPDAATDDAAAVQEEPAPDAAAAADDAEKAEA